MILASGCFDGFHAGHAGYFRAVRGLRDEGEALVVAVAPDEYVRYWKNREPYYPLEDRMAVLDLMTWIDRLVIHDVTGVAKVIADLQPRVFVKGADWQRAGGVPEDVALACAHAGTQIVYIDEVSTRHSSEVA